MTKKKPRPKAVTQEITDLFKIYDKIDSGSIITMFLIMKKEKNGDLVIRRSINEMPVSTDNMYINSMIGLLKDNCKTRGIKLIDSRKVTNN